MTKRRARILRALGYPGTCQASDSVWARVMELELYAPALIHPSFFVEVMGSRETPRQLATLVPHGVECERVGWLLLTIGAELENTVSQWMQEGKTLDALILDCLGTLALYDLTSDTLRRTAEKLEEEDLYPSLCLRPGEDAAPHELQELVFRVLAPGSAIRMGEGYMMQPKKTLSSITLYARGAQAATLQSPCADCRFHNCPYRSQEEHTHAET